MATTDKYDRQLRLWGANGQRRLMESHILLIHANGVGSETLKNLVLPGIGRFTILDDHTVTARDLSSSFFVSPDQLGRPRAEAVRDLLCEMNPDVTGYARVANYQNILQTEPAFFESFSLIITANLPEAHLLPLARLCQEKRLPLVALRSLGLIGAIRLQLIGHEVRDAKKDNPSFDLRIAQPFPALANYCQSYSLPSLSSLEHSHVPFLVILYQAIQHWKNTHNHQAPQSFQEKKEFQEAIKAMARNFHHEQNFQEAVKEFSSAYKPSTPSPELLALLETQRDTSLTASDDDFSFLLRALEIFLRENDNLIPLSGLLPDMTATTDAYVQLQAIFHRKAEEDRAAFRAILRRELARVGERGDRISDEEVEIFCKNCLSVSRLDTNPIAQEIAASSNTAEVVNDTLQSDLYEDPRQTPLLWYLALRAADAFHARYARWPGEKEDQGSLDHDQREVFREMRAIAQGLEIPSELIAGDSEEMETSDSPALLTPAHAQEIVRYGGCELHNISAVIGGIASQEVVKILTRQYEPFNNTYLFNGIACCGAVYSL